MAWRLFRVWLLEGVERLRPGSISTEFVVIRRPGIWSAAPCGSPPCAPALGLRDWAIERRRVPRGNLQLTFEREWLRAATQPAAW
jgi:hypothetical protein